MTVKPSLARRAIPHAAQSERFPSGVASAPWLFPSGLTSKNRGADAIPLRSLTTDRARYGIDARKSGLTAHGSPKTAHAWPREQIIVNRV